MGRSKKLQNFIDKFAEKQFGVSQSQAEKEQICVFCKKKVNLSDFRDALSLKEYRISGICQKCQDKIF